MAAPAKIDPMHQFQIAPLGGGDLVASPFAFTNSALWMLIVLAVILVFVGAKMLAAGWYEIPTLASLGVIVAILAVAAAASLYVDGRQQA